MLVAETIAYSLEHPFGTELNQLDLTEILDGAFKSYIKDVKSMHFPQPEHTYKMNAEELEKLGMDVEE